MCCPRDCAEGSSSLRHIGRLVEAEESDLCPGASIYLSILKHVANTLHNQQHLHSEINLWVNNFLRNEEHWDITSCSQLKVNRRFGGTYLHPPCRISQAR
jgi:hypothetical protein